MVSNDIPQCFEVEELTEREHIALNALAAGLADEYQQRAALAVISRKFCRPHDITFVPGHPDQSGVLAGRAFVGAQILKYLSIPVGKLKEEGDSNAVKL